MSLETEIKALTLAINTLRETIAGQSAPNDAPVQPAPVAPAPVAQVAPEMPPAPFPGTAAAPTLTAPAPVVPPMPAIAPDSVAVNTPRRTPPTMTMGRSSAGTAWANARRRAAPSARWRSRLRSPDIT